MILHYIQISLRNLRKYKTQTAISICAMAVSLTLMAIVTSFLLLITPTPLTSQPYAERVEKISTHISAENLSLILGHQFKNVEEIHFIEFPTSSAVIPTANSGSKDEHSLITQAKNIDRGFLKFIGMKSAYSGKVIEPISSNEVVITEKLAKRLFGKENPIGKSLDIHYLYYPDANREFDKKYIIKDIMEDPSINDNILTGNEEIYTSKDHLNDGNYAACYLLLREGASREDLKKGLKELLSNDDVNLLNAKYTYYDRSSTIIRNCVILFLFLFVLVSYTNYIRQQTQLFRLREREIALRTCLGSQPISLFSLFITEILIVLGLTLVLTLALTSSVTGYLLNRYPSQLEASNVNFDDAIPIVLISTAILFLISIVVVVVSVRKIRLDQTGLALRMKPLPKHRLRNVGLIVQMTVCLIFTWVTVLFFMSIPSLKTYYGIPKDIDKYKKCLRVRVNGIKPDQAKEIYDKVEDLQSVERVYKFFEYYNSFPLDEEKNDYFSYSLVNQNGLDWVDFYDIEIKDKSDREDPGQYIFVSEEFKQKMIDLNLWNGKTVCLPYFGEYDVKGVIEKIPFHTTSQNCLVAKYVDFQQEDESFYDRIILPKEGREKEAMEEINNVINEVLPGRIDIKAESFYNHIAPQYDMINILITIIYILAAISVVTTMSGVYAGVSLDTRRRRKEMALRKLNGAGLKVIAMIFLRTYLWIVFMAVLISLPLCFMLYDGFLYHIFNGDEVFSGISTGEIDIAYAIALVLIIAITSCTIAWKIRNIMKVDPIDYLKE